MPSSAPLYADDKALLTAFREERTKETAFTELVKLYQERLYWHVRRMVGDHDDAHDILQNVFIKVWKALADFREQSQIYTWLYRIATNETLTFLEKKKRRASVSLDNEDYALSERVPAGEPSVDGEQLQARLQKAIDGLPDKQKLVFNLRYFDEMPYEKMSEILGTSVGALKASYHHAVKKIEAYFNPKD